MPLWPMQPLAMNPLPTCIAGRPDGGVLASCLVPHGIDRHGWGAGAHCRQQQQQCEHMNQQPEQLADPHKASSGLKVPQQNVPPP